MDLQVCAIIAIVFCVSLISLFFINQKLRGGKSFEDVLAEKRQLAHLVGGSRYAKKAKRVGDSGGKSSASGGGAKKEKRKQQQRRANEQQQQQQLVAESETANDSDDGSEGSHSAASSSNSPQHQQRVKVLPAELSESEGAQTTEELGSHVSVSGTAQQTKVRSAKLAQLL